MKHSAKESMYFSGYPLKLATEETIEERNQKAFLVVVKHPASMADSKKNIADNPLNWDHLWFSNYE